MRPARKRDVHNQWRVRRAAAFMAAVLAAVYHIQEMEMMMVLLFVVLRRWIRARNGSRACVASLLAFAMPVLASALDAATRPSSRRRWWVKPRAGGAWCNMMRGDEAAYDYWYDNIRMGEDTFRGIVAVLEPYLQRMPTHYRMPTPPDQLVAYALYRWATGELFEHSATSFGMGRETGRVAVRDVTDALLQAYPSEVPFPVGQRQVEALGRFQAKGFPGCYGAIDCTHILIDKPAGERARAYCNRHRKYSIVAQVVAGADLRIYDCFVGWPGSVHDSRILYNSSLWQRAEAGTIFTADPVVLPGEVETRGYFLGDGGYPSLPWLVVPYGGVHPEGSDLKTFDDTQKSLRGCVERAFGRLKNMWRLFLQCHKPDIRSLCDQFRAVCIIHNLLINAGIPLDPRLERRAPHEPPHDIDRDPLPPPVDMTILQARRAGQRLRNSLRDHLLVHNREVAARRARG
ncbi:hypothetical protein CBR_g29635 [Chara braunii]|uniref:DDE Tnp4 domain-containing protein n=1 Tax=Chara braunii TaxID=69332 RepID=A0A388LB00_CHABU|nr:hypothetical protein CBR_g29635 [Chara braunii]|eukprot:GBG79489.1 hypothetical protein CBR_g29635 [Chara braunii]